MIDWLMKLFNVETKRELFGIISGALSFMPTFFIVCIISVKYSALIGVTFLIVTQYLWLNSISICNRSSDEKKKKYMLENEILREEICKLKEDIELIRKSEI